MAEYIDREKIREEVCKDCTRRIGKDGCMAPEACEDLLTALVAADPADVAPVVHARWEFVEDFDGDGHWMCTNCGVEWVFNDGSPEENEAYYCPRCGAKMDGHTTPGPSHGRTTESEV